MHLLFSFTFFYDKYILLISNEYYYKYQQEAYYTSNHYEYATCQGGPMFLSGWLTSPVTPLACRMMQKPAKTKGHIKNIYIKIEATFTVKLLNGED